MGVKAAWRQVVVVCLAALALAWLAPAVWDLARVNAGMIALTRGLMRERGDQASAALAQAEGWLREAVDRSPESARAWRGLGLAWAAQGKTDYAVAAWQRVPGMRSELMLWAEHAFVLKDYQRALEWYEWAAKVDPTKAAPWYYQGRAHQALEAKSAALQAYLHALEVGEWSGFSTSSLYYRAGTLYRLQGSTEDLARAWQAFEAAVSADDYDENWERADCYYQRGMTLWVQQRPAGEYLVEYERAVAIDPLHAAAYARLGFTYFERDRDVKRAEGYLRQAMQLNPEDGWPYVLLGDVYATAGMSDLAAREYERALEFEPTRDDARRRLDSLRPMS